MGKELEEGPALSLLAGVMADVQVTAIHLDQTSLPAVNASRDSWWRLTGVRPEDEPSFTILADPYSFDIEHCIRGLDRAYPGSTVVGGLTSAASQPGQACLIAGGDVHRAGALLIAWTGDVRIEGVVGQGCRPVGDPLFVTSSDGNRIHEIDGKAPRAGARRGLLVAQRRRQGTVQRATAVHRTRPARSAAVGRRRATS